MRCVLIGYGYWGKIMEKYIVQSPHFELVGICDPHYKDALDLDEVLQTKTVECAFVCVPIGMHYQTVKKMLGYGLHVFCEKPLCRTVKEMEELFYIADKKHLTLFTDYIYTVSPSVQHLKLHLLDFGRIRYVDMSIKQFGNFYSSDHVFEVIGVHMLSVLAYIPELYGNRFKITGVDIVANGNSGMPEAGIIFFQTESLRGKIECSLLSDVKERKIKVLSEHGIIALDMMAKQTVRLFEDIEKDKVRRQEMILDYSFDEANNISFILEEFNNAVYGCNNSNREVTIRVQEALQQIEGFVGGKEGIF